MAHIALTSYQNTINTDYHCHPFDPASPGANTTVYTVTNLTDKGKAIGLPGRLYRDTVSHFYALARKLNLQLVYSTDTSGIPAIEQAFVSPIQIQAGTSQTDYATPGGGYSSVTQADYFTFTNPYGTTWAVWLDKAGNGSVPTGSTFISANYKIKAELATSDTTATLVSTKIYNALLADPSWANANITLTTGAYITLAQQLSGLLAGVTGYVAAGTPGGSITGTIHTAGGTLAAGTKGSAFDKETFTYDIFANVHQADYILFENVAGKKWAVWLDLNANGTAPVGASYLAADYKIKVPIVTGNNATVIAEAAVAAITADASYATGNFTATGTATLVITQTHTGVVALNATMTETDGTTAPGGANAVVHTTAGTNGTAYSVQLGSLGGSISGLGNLPYIQTITCPTNATDALDGLYFYISSKNTNYYVWFSSLTALDPAIAGRIGIKVSLGHSDANTVVAAKLAAALQAVTDLDGYVFTATALSNVVTSTNVLAGVVLSATADHTSAALSYSTTQTGTPAFAPTFAVTSGTLPVWASLSSTGLLTGTPNIAATSTFVVTMTDGYGDTVAQQFTVTVS